MISSVGSVLVLAALLFAAFGSTVGFATGLRPSARGLEIARNAAWGFGIALVLANLLMIWALWNDDFSVGYVAEVGGTQGVMAAVARIRARGGKV